MAFDTHNEINIVNGSINIYKVSNENDHAVVSYWNQMIESPDGSKIVYTNFKDNVPEGKGDKKDAYIWCCNPDCSEQKEIFSVMNITDHHGARINWIDNDRIAFMSDDQTYIGSIGKKAVLHGPYFGTPYDYNLTNKKILLNSKDEGYAAVRQVNADTGESSTIITACDLSHFKDQLQGSDDPLSWTFSQTYWSVLVNKNWTQISKNYT